MRCRIGSLGLKVLVLVFTLVLGVSLTKLVHRMPKSHTSCRAGLEAPPKRVDYVALPRVNFCDLMAAPESYEGKMVLLPVKHRGQGMLRGDELCMQGDPKFDIEFVDGDLREVGAEAFWSGGEMTLAGRFSKRPFAGDSPKYRFRVFQIVEARLFVAPH
ncbi:MAG TPA: hypothetical protein VJP89_02625 [Pyrinomonadaceae bacterium]|nr:hypothetical protein [Pyrinomonadaceae bacterium]